MAAVSNLIGIHVAVALKHPPNSIVHGRVAEIVPETSTLVLHDVFFPDTGHQLRNWTVAGSQIADISIAGPLPGSQGQKSTLTQPPNVSFNVSNARTEDQAATQSSQSDAPVHIVAQSHPFVDPAIVSVGRKPSTSSQHISNVPILNSTTILSEAPSTPLKIHPSQNLELLRHQHTIPTTTAKAQRSRATQNKKTFKNTAATLSAPFSGLDIGVAADEQIDETDDAPPADNVRCVSVNTTRTGKPMDDPPQTAEKKRSKQKARKKKEAIQAAQPLSADGLQTCPDTVRRPTDNGTYHGSGGRQTPILQDSNNASPRASGLIAGKVGYDSASSVRRNRRQQRAMNLEARNNGWATEDATDIQELPDFDFEANLSKFDKRSVFEQMRTDDRTSKESRLVSINRLPPARPGTYGGKNLHPTENVLDSPRTRARQGSLYLSSDSDDAFSFLDGGRSSSRQRVASIKLPPTRSNSSHNQPDDSVPSTQYPRKSQPFHRPQNTHAAASSPRNAQPSPLQSSRLSPPDSPSLPQPHFRLHSSNLPCPTTTPAAMTAIEEVAETDFALPAATMTENAGRGIAEVTMTALNPGGRRLARENLRLNGKPMALFLVGNHKVGARALAAARHVRNRGVRVVVCVLGPFWEGEGEIKREVDRLVKLGVWVRGWQGEVQELLAGRLKERGQPEIVVEALLGTGGGYERLGGEDQMALREMVGWINKGFGGVVVSVDCPSGVNASTGELVSVVSAADSSSMDPSDDEALEVKAKHVVCIGAPRTGLLRALQRVRMGVAGRPVNALGWQIWVVDIGVNKAWKQCGIPGGAEGGVKFGPNWVVSVGFFDGSEGTER